MNGWMPRLSPDGQHVASGMGELWVDGQYIADHAWTPVWLDEDTLCVSGGDGIYSHEIASRVYTPLVPGVRVNGLAAGNGRWAFYGTGFEGGGIYRDDGSFRPGLDPAVWGTHLAWVVPSGDGLWLDDVCIRQAAIRTTATPPAIRASMVGLAWVEYHGDQRQAWGLLWGSEPQPLAPTWRSLFFAVPVVGPHGELWLLAGDGERLILVPWGAHVGYLVAEGGILHPDAAWTGDGWRVVWNSPEGALSDVSISPDAPLVDFMADAPPPPPKPSVRIVSVEPVWGTVPFTAIAHAEILHADMHRWRLNGQIHHPHNDNPHAFEIRESGTHDISLQASGPGGVTPMEHYTVTGLPPSPVTRGFYSVQAGFGDPVAPERLQAVKAFEWQTVRLQCFPNPQIDGYGFRTAEAADGALAAGLFPLVIVRGPQDMVGLTERCDLEAFNEPDIGSKPTTPRMTPQEYAKAVRNVYPSIGHRKLWVGAISNLGSRNLRWLREMVAAGIPWDVGISVHWYPDYKRGVFLPTLSAIREVVEIADGREWAVTEFGFHVGTWTSGMWWWKRTWRLTENEQAFCARNTFAVFRSFGAQFATWYQLGSGPNPDEPLDNYGLRRFDETWRPVAHIPEST